MKRWAHLWDALKRRDSREKLISFKSLILYQLYIWSKICLSVISSVWFCEKLKREEKGARFLLKNSNCIIENSAHRSTQLSDHNIDWQSYWVIKSLKLWINKQLNILKSITNWNHLLSSEFYRLYQNWIQSELNWIKRIYKYMNWANQPWRNWIRK